VERSWLRAAGVAVSQAQPLRVLEQGLEELGIAPAPAVLQALLRLAAMVVEWGRRMNLTGHRSEEAVVRRLVLDAAALLTHAPPFRSLADLGSGAGFPGVPIAILRPAVQVTLVDSRERRHHFQRALLRELGLSNVRALRGRLESLAPIPHQAVVAQALAPAARALRWMLPWAEPGGWLLLPGAEHAPESIAIEGVSEERVVRYRVPLGGPERSLWVGRRLPEPR
jgi:16S rRNA (guanine527-N7)-methyltransferase